MRRLSDLVRDVECAACKIESLKIVHCEISAKTQTVSVGVVCSRCSAKDLLRFSLGELGPMKDEAVNCPSG